MHDFRYAFLSFVSFVSAAFIATVVVRRGPDRADDLAAAAVLAVAAVLWLPASHPVEGIVLFELDKTHGVCTSDLPVIPAMLLVGWLVARSLPRVGRLVRLPGSGRTGTGLA